MTGHAYGPIGLPFVCLAVNLFSQISYFHLSGRLGLLRSEVAGFIAGFVLFFAGETVIFGAGALTFADFIGLGLADFLIYLSLSFMYFNFINLGETARRLRILIELCDAPQGLSYPQILARYNAKEILERRISRLMKNGQIVFRHGRYYIGKPLLLCVAHMMLWIKGLLFIKKVADKEGQNDQH